MRGELCADGKELYVTYIFSMGDSIEEEHNPI